MFKSCSTTKKKIKKVSFSNPEKTIILYCTEGLNFYCFIFFNLLGPSLC